MKHTTESFISLYRLRFPESKIEITGEYKGDSSTMHCMCKICGFEFDLKCYRIRDGSHINGCDNCEEKLKLNLLHKKYIEKFPDSKMILVSISKNEGEMRAIAKCGLCGKQKEYEFSSLLHGKNKNGCINCVSACKTKIGEDYTTESFIKMYKEKFPESKIEIIGEYTGSERPIEYKCKICNSDYIVNKTRNLTVGMYSKGCNECNPNSMSKKKPIIEELNAEHLKNFPDSKYRAVNNIRRSNAKILAKCSECGKEMKVTIQDFMNENINHNCPIKINLDEIRGTYATKFPLSSIRIVSGYYNKKNKFIIKYECDKCGSIKEKEYKDLLDGTYKDGCYKCKPKYHIGNAPKNPVFIKDGQHYKKCTCCNLELEISNFYRRKNGSYLNECKYCLKLKAQKNRKSINARNLQRIRENPELRLNKRLRGMLKDKFDNKYRIHDRIGILGCTIQEWKLHLEAQFESWMNWDNYGNGYGKWNIDHIVPVSWFDLTIPDNQKVAFHYTNTKPISSILNSSKTNKYAGYK